MQSGHADRQKCKSLASQYIDGGGWGRWKLKGDALQKL